MPPNEPAVDESAPLSRDSAAGDTSTSAGIDDPIFSALEADVPPSAGSAVAVADALRLFMARIEWKFNWPLQVQPDIIIYAVTAYLLLSYISGSVDFL
jgi:hypothetical protein